MSIYTLRIINQHIRDARNERFPANVELSPSKITSQLRL